MSTHLTIGQYGERTAVEWLLARGFIVLHLNWRFGRKEIDIIATKSGTLHIIEVKTRRGNDYGSPEEQVNRRKLKYLKEATDGYLEENPQWRKIQFDIIAITLEQGQNRIVLLEDIY